MLMPQQRFAESPPLIPTLLPNWTIYSKGYYRTSMFFHTGTPLLSNDSLTHFNVEQLKQLQSMPNIGDGNFSSNWLAPSTECEPCRGS